MTESIHAEGYQVFIGPESLIRLNDFIAGKPASTKFFILTDENSNRYCLPALLGKVESLQQVPVIALPAGEMHKTLSAVEEIVRQLVKYKADRASVILNLGGGVIGDLGGFTASVFNRGVEFVQIPTTLLSMVDSSIGGKTGVNIDNKKNIAGTFNNPSAVFIDPGFLTTLPHRELRSGFAEVIKHTVINVSDNWRDLPGIEQITEDSWTELIVRSVRFKNDVVQKDFRDHHRRNVLNFGHTLGHALEGVSVARGEDPLLHGEAVALGMMAALLLSAEMTGFPEKEAEELIAFLQSVYPDLNCPGYDRDIAEFLRSDKKSKQGELRFVLLDNTRNPRIGVAVREDQAARALNRVAESYRNKRQLTGA